MLGIISISQVKEQYALYDNNNELMDMLTIIIRNIKKKSLSWRNKVRR
jgi:hypothetical protein